MKMLEHSELNDLVEAFYAESSSDLVGLWEIVKEVENIFGKGDTVRDKTLTVVRALLAKGLLAGDPPYDLGGYAPWTDQNPDGVIERVGQEWRRLDHTPNIPDIAWFGRPT